MTEEADTNSTILTISELIDNAFGDADTNTVHHKHVQAVLYILARQLRVLQRRVEVKLSPYQERMQKSSSSLSVTEVRLRAMTDSKTSISKKGTGKQKVKKEKSPGSSDKSKSTSSTSPVKSTSAKTSTYGASSDKASTFGRSPSPDDGSPVPDKKSSAGKRSDKSSATSKASAADDGSSSKTSKKAADKSSTIDDTSIAETSSSAGKKSPAGKESAADDTSAAERASKAGKKTATGKTLAAIDTSTADASKASSATKKSSTGKTVDTDDTSTADKASSAGKKTLIKLSTGDKTSSSDQASSLTSDKKSAEKTGKRGTAQERRVSADTASIDPQDYQRLLNDVEESRERELRVIHKRADSHVSREKTPTPIASMDSFEATYEKLLVVERVPAEEARARAARERSAARGETAPRLSVVTQEQFMELVSAVRYIQQKLAPVGPLAFPENAELMQELRKGASLTEAMAALQLSARLEATEKTLTNLLSVVTDLASQTPGYEPTPGVTDDIEVLFGASRDKKTHTSPSQRLISVKSSKGSSIKQSQTILPTPSPETELPSPPTEEPTARLSSGMPKTFEIITYEELETELQRLYDNVMKELTEKVNQSNAHADTATKLAQNLEKRLDASLNIGNKMDTLETMISNYADQINSLDTGLSAQLTNFQESLTQMQHDLETGLENMAEVLANTGGDATAVAELNAHFSDLQMDIDDAVQRQRELRVIQNNLSMDLDRLRAEIEMLRETKSDRDEVADALRDKAGLGDLNGLISHQQYNAVRGDMEKRISMAYDKFNSQELVWQRAIDDLLRELHEKADVIQVDGLRQEINYNLENLRKKMKFISDIVGEPAAAALMRQLSRDSACLSCSAPAHMLTEDVAPPILPAMRPPAVGAEAPKPKEDGDHGLCYQGFPVKHAIDPRAHACNRWCGGSHTLLNAQKSRVPPSITLTSLERKVGQERGTDGKMYAVDEQVTRKPCSLCAIPSAPVVSRHELGKSDEGVRFV